MVELVQTKKIDKLSNEELLDEVFSDGNFIQLSNSMSKEQYVEIGKQVVSIFEWSEMKDRWGLGKIIILCISYLDKNSIREQLKKINIDEIGHVWFNAFKLVRRNDVTYFNVGLQICTYAERQIDLAKQYELGNENYFVTTYNSN